jgi:hypothetical protein
VNDLAHVNQEKKKSIIAGIDFIVETLFDDGDPKSADPVDRVSSLERRE